MDILDTPGDWIQLGLWIIYALFVSGGILGFCRHIIGSFLTTVAMCALMWYNVYDYDTILGLSIGSVLGAILYNNIANDFLRRGNLYDYALSTQVLWMHI